jgi:hypothetical protein
MAIPTLIVVMMAPIAPVDDLDRFTTLLLRGARGRRRVVFVAASDRREYLA